MDTVRGFGDDRIDYEIDTAQDSDPGGVADDPFAIGTDERRMHVRAYNHWVSLLRGRAYPSIEDLDPANIADFGPHSVLLDFSRGIEDPTIQFLGRALREECGLDSSVTRVAEVPTRSLLSRLTDHYLQIIANRAPIGFEAEFVGTRGHTTLYRGILMPFSSDEDTIDFIYGVINWKEMVDPLTQATLDAELDAAVRAQLQTSAAPIWADGPSAGMENDGDDAGCVEGLADRLAMARESAAAVRAADVRTRAALYRALGRAHDFALAADDDRESYAELLADAGLTVQARAPMTPVAKLVFGADYDKTRLTEFATVLGHARDEGIAAGGLATFLEGFDGGIKGVVKAARAAKKTATPRSAPPTIASRQALASVSLDTGATPGSIVLLIARAGEHGMLEVVGAVRDAPALVRRAVAKIG